jgi:hypothetical protein
MKGFKTYFFLIAAPVIYAICMGLLAYIVLTLIHLRFNPDVYERGFIAGVFCFSLVDFVITMVRNLKKEQ